HAKGRRDRKGSPFPVLRRPGLESNEATVPIHLRPRQREHLGAAPSGREREANAICHIWLETLADRVDLVGFGEALPDVVLRRVSGTPPPSVPPSPTPPALASRAPFARPRVEHDRAGHSLPRVSAVTVR